MVTTCSECGLYGGIKVNGFGPEVVDVVIVGEAPGVDEARIGRPFVGRSGMLLNKLLSNVGIDRYRLYITNACLCKPPANRNPTVKEIRACRQRLLTEIDAHKPSLVVALGKIALMAISGQNRSIKSERGRVFYTDDFRGIPIFATYHPAAVLRSPSLYVDIMHDFKQVTYIMRHGIIEVGSCVPDYTVLTDEGEAYTASMLWGAPFYDNRIIVDIETASNGDILCLGFAGECGGEREVYVVPRENCHIFKNRFNMCAISGHNVKFDMQECVKFGFGKPTTGYDTMLLHYLHDERPGHHDLESVAVEHIAAKPWKGVSKKYKNRFEDIPRDELYLYNARDVTYTARLINPLIALLSDKQRHLYDDLLVPASDTLSEMETVGIGVDVAYLKELIHKYESAQGPIKESLFAMAGHQFNPNSYQQVSKILFEEISIPWIGKYRTDEDTLKRISHLHPFPAKLLEYRKVQRYVSTTLNGLLNNVSPNGRIHTTFNLHGTVTGRLSSSNPVNLQNIPRGQEARNVFIARPGWHLVEGDLSQAEIRVLAMLSGDSNLIDAVNTSDVHKSTAALMFGVKLDDITPAQRQAAKHLVFGIVYGMQARSLGLEVGCSEVEAQELIAKYFLAFPVAKAWIMAARAQAVNCGFVESPFGRKRRFDFITRDNRGEVERQAVNAPIQATASDITLYALGYLPYELRNSRTYPVLTVHDSILLETCEEPREVARLLVRHMQREHKFFGNVQMLADAKIGTPWGNLLAVGG